MDSLMDYINEMDCISLALICAPIVAVIICGILLINNTKNDTMQRNSSKACHASTKQHHHKDQHNNVKNDCSDSGVSTNGHQQNHQNSSGSSTTNNKQRKPRTGNKRQDAANNNNLSSSNASSAANGQKRRGSSGFTITDWLQNDVYCYERRFISSSVEDKMTSRHNPAHRNSTSSEAAGSDDLNSSSSNEDLSNGTYIVQTKTGKTKSAKSRQRRQQKRKQNGTILDGSPLNMAQPMDIDEESKENQKPNGGKQKTSTAALNLRKQCTKAAALKAALNNTKLPKCSGNALSTSASNSSVCSSLSSASSISSINTSVSSSASSSPTHSANSSPTASPTARQRNAEHLKKMAQSFITPLRQFSKINFTEQDLVQQLRRYIIDPNLLRVYGFPVESVHYEGCVEIYKCLPKHLAEEAITKDNQRHHRHFYGRKKSNVINAYDGLYSGSSSQQWYPNASVDSGHDSGDSSPRFTDSDSSEVGEEDAPIMAFYTPDGVYQIFSEYYNSVEKQCVRCSKMFQVDSNGKYMTLDNCSYHSGKLHCAFNGKCFMNTYSCCRGLEMSEGCLHEPFHVWNGTVVGINGPYNDFVHTQPKVTTKHQKHPKVYAMDCEMSYTGLGLEVTKVTVIGYDGAAVYEHFVRPRAHIVDYNTRYSGITEYDLHPDSNNSIKTFEQVQEDLLNLFDADTILIGHGLDNDLRVLRLVHKTIVDTSLIFSHSTGYPYRRSLKNLTKSFLKRDIQCGDMGHSSFEDSRACLELMFWKVQKDLRDWNYE